MLVARIINNFFIRYGWDKELLCNMFDRYEITIRQGIYCDKNVNKLLNNFIQLKKLLHY